MEGIRIDSEFWNPVAFPSDSNHKGEPELANKGHEVAFICEYNEKKFAWHDLLMDIKQACGFDACGGSWDGVQLAIWSWIWCSLNDPKFVHY